MTTVKNIHQRAISTWSQVDLREPLPKGFNRRSAIRAARATCPKTKEKLIRFWIPHTHAVRLVPSYFALGILVCALNCNAVQISIPYRPFSSALSGGRLLFLQHRSLLFALSDFLRRRKCRLVLVLESWKATSTQDELLETGATLEVLQHLRSWRAFPTSLIPSVSYPIRQKIVSVKKGSDLWSQPGPTTRIWAAYQLGLLYMTRKVWLLMSGR